MPILGLLILGTDLFCAYHAIKTNRTCMWLGLIICVPLFGSLLYLTTQFWPDYQAQARRATESRNRTANHAAMSETRMPVCNTGCGAPKVTLRAPTKREMSEATEKKLEIAHSCLNRGMYAEAIRHYEHVRTVDFGLHAHKPAVMAGLARARFAAGDFQDARNLLLKLRDFHRNYHPADVDVLAARAAAELGETATAIAELQSAADRHKSLEARYRLAELLHAEGEKDRARDELTAILANATRFRLPAADKDWIDQAKRGLAALG